MANPIDVAKDNAEKVAGVIPTLYYDIIARIIPGAAFIAAVAYPTLNARPIWTPLHSLRG